MKSLFFAITLIAGMLFLAGCPVGMDYPPDVPGSKPIDKKLLGNWKTNSEAEFKRAEVKQKDANTYEIEVFETSDMFSPSTTKFNAWVTTISGKNFIYCQAENESAFYTYCYTVKGKKLSIFDVGLLVNGKDGVTSIEAFREEIAASLPDPTCLSEEKVYKK